MEQAEKEKIIIPVFFEAIALGLQKGQCRYPLKCHYLVNSITAIIGVKFLPIIPIASFHFQHKNEKILKKALTLSVKNAE